MAVKNYKVEVVVSEKEEIPPQVSAFGHVMLCIVLGGLCFAAAIWVNVKYARGEFEFYTFDDYAVATFFNVDIVVVCAIYVMVSLLFSFRDCTNSLTTIPRLRDPGFHMTDMDGSAFYFGGLITGFGLSSHIFLAGWAVIHMLQLPESGFGRVLAMIVVYSIYLSLGVASILAMIRLIVCGLACAEGSEDLEAQREHVMELPRTENQTDAREWVLHFESLDDLPNGKEWVSEEEAEI